MRPRRPATPLLTAALLCVLLAGTAACAQTPPDSSLAGADTAPTSVTPLAVLSHDPPPLSGAAFLQSADLDELLPPGPWAELTVDIQGPWLRRSCERGPMDDEGAPTAGAGSEPASQQTWMWGREQGFELGTATVDLLRWSGGDGAASAAQWVNSSAASDASACREAAVVTGDGEAVTAVVSRWPDPPAEAAVDHPAEPVWAVQLFAVAGPTALAVQAGRISADSADAAWQEHGPAVQALLQRLAERVAVTDAAVVRSGVTDADLAPFSDPTTWDGLQPLHSVGPPPEVWIGDGDDFAASFPGAASWESGAQAAVAGTWRLTACRDGLDDWVDMADLPSGFPDAHEIGPLFLARGGELDGAVVKVVVLRWPETGQTRYPPAVAAPEWSLASGADALTCDGALPTSAGGLPGSAPQASVVPHGDGWRVLVSSAGGPTAVRVRAELPGGTAEEAVTSSVAMLRRVVADVVRADAEASPA